MQRYHLPALFAVAVLCLANTPAGSAPASPEAEEFHYFTDSRADLEIPAALFAKPLEAVGFAGQKLGFTAEEMSNYGEALHALTAVKRLFRDALEVPRYSGRVSDGFLSRATDPGGAAEYAWRILGIRAGRGQQAPTGDDWGVDWIEQGTSVDGALAAVQALSGHELPKAWTVYPLPVRRLIVRFLVAAVEAGPIIREAFDRRLYRDAGFEHLLGASNKKLLEFVGAPFMDEHPRRLAFDALEQVDLRFLAFGSIIFMQRAAGAIREWQASAGGRALTGLPGLSFETPVGTVVILGTGDDQATAAEFIFDLGGNDEYAGAGAPRRFAVPISAAVDLAGDDVWRGGEALACGNHGIGAVFDLSGDDHYIGEDNALGCAWFGTGVLCDYSGNDRYEGGTWTQGAAHAGVGLLLDIAGDDSYTCAAESQGFGGTLGLGALIDVEGEDRYLARLDGNISEVFRGRSVSFAQGAAYGRRADFGDGHSLAGGIGMLADGGGDDSYIGGVYCQGTAYWWALGMLEDRGGDDTYSSVQYSQGSAPHMAIGCMVDLAGNDRYNLETEHLYMQNMACARDGSIGVFFDGAGNDRYRHGNRSAGSGEINAIGLFWDRHGDDQYIAERDTPSVSTRSYGGAGHHNLDPRSFRSVLPTAGVFLDTAGTDCWVENRPDSFGGQDVLAANNTSWIHSEKERQRGAGFDLEYYRPVPEAVAGDETFSVHRFETTCNSYLLTCKASRRFLVVDPGPGIEPVLRAWRELGYVFDSCWITHDHMDHIAGLGLLTGDLAVPTRGHPNVQAEIAVSRMNWERWGFDEMTPIRPVRLSHFIVDGEAVTLGKLTFKALFAPGHSRGSLCYLLDDRLLFSGDVLFKNSVGRTDFPGCDRERFCRSLSEQLWDLPESVVVLPGHMEETTLGEEKQNNWLFQDYVREARGEPPIPRPWVGIGLGDETEAPGVLLNQVLPESPALAAGLLAGDMVLRFGGAETNDRTGLIKAIRAHGIGDVVEVHVLRDGKPLTLSLTMGTRRRE